jgi:hypothetical protein
MKAAIRASGAVALNPRKEMLTLSRFCAAKMSIARPKRPMMT